MPWSELSQRDFLEHVVKFQAGCSSSDGILLGRDSLVSHSVRIMEAAVSNPDRLFQSAFHAKQNEGRNQQKTSKELPSSPKIASLFTRRDTVKKQRPPAMSNSLTSETKGVTGA